MSEESLDLFGTEGLDDTQKELLGSLSEDQIKLITARAEQANKSLVANRDSILAEKREEEAQRKKAEELLKEHDAQTQKIKADLEEAQQAKELDEAKKGEDFKKVQELQNQAFEKERSELLAKQKEFEEKAQTLLQEKNELSLSTALISANVTKDGLPAVKTLMQSRMSLTEENGILLDGAPIDDYLKAWVDSDEGKFFVKAPPNQGSGASPGSNGGGSAKSWKELSIDERAVMRKTYPEEAAKLSNAA